jgi:hypothetical protein
VSDEPVKQRLQGRSDFKDFLAAAASIATLGSAVIYGLLALGYSEFYRELGIAPRDVGVEVSKTLGDAVGLAIVLTVVSLLLAVLLLVVWRLAVRSESISGFAKRFDGTAWLLAQGKLRQFNVFFVAASVLSFLVTAIAIRDLANTRADDVKKGRPVEPLRVGPGLRDFIPLEVLDVHADPVLAIVSLRSGEEVPPRVDDARKGGQLFYIGRSTGSAALYDARTQHVFVVPATSFVFEVSNCETKLNVDEACRRNDR